MSHPAIVLAMQPSRTEHVLPDEVLRRLDGIGRLLDAKPLQRFDDERARRLLAQAERPLLDVQSLDANDFLEIPDQVSAARLPGAGHSRDDR